jgi:hypothetical protein
MEHQDEKEKPGEKGKEQEQQEENRSVTPSAREFEQSPQGFRFPARR